MSEFIENKKRKTSFIIFILIIFSIFTFRLIQLQILYANVYGKKSEANSIRRIAREPIRGLMFDRNGIIVVDNRPSYGITITPAEYNNSYLNFLTKVLNIDTGTISEKINKGRKYNRFAPIKIKRDVDINTLAIIEENRDKLIGVDYDVESKRFYPTRAKATHLFGYTKEISDQQLVEMGNEYIPGDNVGATGLEAAYERYLRGQKGYNLVTINALGQIIGVYNDGKNDIPVREGDDLYLALDANLQALAESLLSDKRGAIVAVDPNDGGVLALVSKPDYDLTLFGSVTPPEIWKALINDENKPLFNRATLTRYPPGSTFKMVLAAAALEEGIINTNWRVNCTGAFHFGTKIFHDLHTHGSTNVIEAIQRSCNVFFYQLMLKTGLERWSYYGKEFGFGSPTGIDILEENSGLLPSEDYFNKVYGKGKWTQGYLVSLGIGQGEIGVSPIQMACYAATIANKGYYHTPHAVLKIKNKLTGDIMMVPTETRKLDISEKVWDILREGMFRCVNEIGGTGQAAKVKGVAVCGKTGTAQNPLNKDHAWFIGFAPIDNPKIAICVLVENAGFGGAIAAPIAGLCIEQYLYGELIRNNPMQVISAANLENEQTKAQ